MQSAAGAFRGTGIEPCAGLCERLALQAAAVGLVAECKEAVLRRMVFPRPQAVMVEQTGYMACHGRRRIDDRHAVSGDDPLEKRHQEGVMGASQHHLVGAAAEHLLHRAADARLGLGRLLPILLDQLDEPFADGGDDLDPSA